MKHRRLILVAIGVVAGLGIIAFFTRGFWRDQFDAYHMGRLYQIARLYQRLPEGIDTVEIFTFGDSPAADDREGFVGDGPLKTTGHKTLIGKDAKEVVQRWGNFMIGPEFQSLCFEPAYGLQFKQGGKIVFQTAVCWECSGFTVPVPPFGIEQYGFDAKSQGAQDLLRTLEKHLPLQTNSLEQRNQH